MAEPLLLRLRSAAAIFGLCVGVLASAVLSGFLSARPFAQAATQRTAPDDPAPVAAPPVVLPAQEFQVPATATHPAYSLYTPEGPAVPRTALVCLHGMGGNGPGFAALLLPYARAHNMVVIAPTMPYGDWRDPNQLVREEASLVPQVAAMLDGVLAETGVPIAGRVTLFGFSRGAQEALRFALFFPDRVQAVAALSAGTYTLPLRNLVTSTGTTLAAPMPYGIADAETATGRAVDPSKLGRVRFLIGVGAADNRAGDVPRQWDPFVGATRVERAERFAGTLRQLGVQTETAVVPGTGHEVNEAMLERVTAFIARVADEPQA